MSDLQDRLDAMAGEATARLRPLPFDQAVRRRNRRRASAIGVPMVVVVVVAALVAISAWPERSHRPFSVSIPSPASGPAPAQYQKLVPIVREYVGTEYAGEVQVVSTSAKNMPSPPYPDLGDTAVYVVVTGPLSNGWSAVLEVKVADFNVAYHDLVPSGPSLTGLGTLYQLDVPPLPSTTVPSADVCTTRDLEAPTSTAIPPVVRLSSTLTLGDSTFNPPTASPKLTAVQAWAAMRGSYSSEGPARLYAAQMGTRLVWVFLATHQPEISTGGPPGRGPIRPVCQLGDELTVIDATTGSQVLMESGPLGSA